MATTTDILIVDDHQMIRDGIKASLAMVSDIRVVSEADTPANVFQKLKQHPNVEVVVMDISLGSEENGIALTQSILKQYPDVKILGLSMHDEKAYILKMLEAGALGYVLKDTGMDELVDAIHKVARGESYFSQGAAAAMMQDFIKQKGLKVKTKGGFTEELTRREREVLVLIANEYTNSEIADTLFLSPRTVDTHRRNLILKLKVKNTAGLVRFAIKNGLVSA
jgi:DNA-binding NarL/FixJ family response regulator